MLKKKIQSSSMGGMWERGVEVTSWTPSKSNLIQSIFFYYYMLLNSCLFSKRVIQNNRPPVSLYSSQWGYPWGYIGLAS
ncbi:hypothetical protein FKM82_012970 [Ascaphus truei]